MPPNTCPHILAKGARKGQICGEKCKDPSIPYCRTHLRNIGVRKELSSQGIDVVTKEPDSILNRNTNTLSMPKPIDSNYIPPVIKNEKVEKNTSKFVSSFSANIDKHLLSDQPVNMDALYDELDNDFDPPADGTDATYDNPIINEDSEVVKLRAQVNDLRSQKLAAERKIGCMYSMKTLAFTGVGVLCDIVEQLGGTGMGGYKEEVLLNEGVNLCLDEMCADLEYITGLSEQPCYVRLLFAMGAIGAVTRAKNNFGIRMKEPRCNISSDFTDDDENNINNIQDLGKDGKYNVAYPE